jgi:hypothetical protein
MNRARILAATALLAVTALPACNGLHTPTAAEQGAKKMEKASAKARALASRIAFSPDAVSKTLPVDGGEARELTQTLLAPAEAAKELRTLASEVAGAGATDAQRRDAKVLATRMRRDALMLDLMDLERIAQVKSGLARQIGDFADPDELTGVGLAAVMEQVDRYDPSLGYSFSTVARPRIEGAMIDFLREQGKQRMVPRGGSLVSLGP